MEDMNAVIIVGTVATDPRKRTFPNGDVLLQYEISTVVGDTTSSIPITTPDPAFVPETDSRVRIVGYVRRRFFRAGGATASRTEVIATQTAKI